MNYDRARVLLATERARVEELLGDTATAGQDNRTAADEQGDMFDPAEPLIAEGTDDAVTASLRDRLDSLKRAEQRLEAGTYGLSVQSGLPISEARLEADPAAELTLEEAEQGPEGAR